VIITFRLPPELFMTPRIPPPTHCCGRGRPYGGWTQIFGGRPKESEPETSRPVEKRNFYQFHGIRRPHWGYWGWFQFNRNFIEIFCTIEQAPAMPAWAIVWRYFPDHTFSHFDRTPACDRQTDRQQIDTRSMTALA